MYGSRIFLVYDAAASLQTSGYLASRPLASSSCHVAFESGLMSTTAILKSNSSLQTESQTLRPGRLRLTLGALAVCNGNTGLVVSAMGVMG